MGEIADSRREGKVHEVSLTKYVIDLAGPVCVMLANDQREFVIQQPLQDVRSLAAVRRNSVGRSGAYAAFSLCILALMISSSQLYPFKG